jgi:hypothetical protein
VIAEQSRALKSATAFAGTAPIKTVQKGQFPVIGFVKDPTGVAALRAVDRLDEVLQLGRHVA